MREKVALNKPTMFVMLGLPGAGKTYTARQLSEALGVFVYHADEYRAELFDTPEHDQTQDDVVDRLTLLNVEKIMSFGKSLIIDAETTRWSLRRELKELAKTKNYRYLIIWIQTDANSAFLRSSKRDRRTQDNKFAVEIGAKQFDKMADKFTKPRYEDYIVISGKHAFKAQFAMILGKLKEIGALSFVAPTQQRVAPTRTRISLGR